MIRTPLLLGALLCCLGQGMAVADNCIHDCGYVTSVKEVEQDGKGTGLGAVAGGVAGGLLGHTLGSKKSKTLGTVVGAAGGALAGHVAEEKLKSEKLYRVVIQMDNGGNRTLDLKQNPGLVNGERVYISDNVPYRYTGR